MPRSANAIRDGLNGCQHWIIQDTGGSTGDAKLAMKAYFRKKLADLRAQKIAARFESYDLEDCKLALSLLNSKEGVGATPCDAPVPSAASSSYPPKTGRPKNKK